MPVPLRHEEKSEWPLVAFTLCVPASVGLTLFSLIDNRSGLLAAAAAVALASAGMIASIAHLAKPLRAPASLRNVKSSWLSREIAAVSVFWVLLIVWFAAEATTALGNSICAAIPWDAISIAGRVCAAVWGATLLAVIANAYKVPTRPAWCGNECLAELVACALGAGAALHAVCIDTAAELPRLDPLQLPCFAACVAALLLDIFSHRSRMRRLESLCGKSDERVPLTIANYAKLQPKIRLAWAIEVAATACAALSLWWLVLVLETVAHGMQRSIFYAIPVQVRYAARLRK